jgi:hypothetical protein
VSRLNAVQAVRPPVFCNGYVRAWSAHPRAALKEILARLD